MRRMRVLTFEKKVIYGFIVVFLIILTTSLNNNNFIKVLLMILEFSPREGITATNNEIRSKFTCQNCLQEKRERCVLICLNSQNFHILEQKHRCESHARYDKVKPKNLNQSHLAYNNFFNETKQNNMIQKQS